MEDGAEDTCDIKEKSAMHHELLHESLHSDGKAGDTPTRADLERKFRREDLDESPRIDGPLLRKAINLFKNNKSCAGDKVVAEMLSVLDEDLLETLAEAFSRRILSNEDNFIWQAPRESYHAIRYAYDPRP